jgi:hypothetical protein
MVVKFNKKRSGRTSMFARQQEHKLSQADCTLNVIVTIARF